MIKETLTKLAAGEGLAFEETEAFIDAIAGGEITDAQIAAFLTGLRIKGERPDELAGCVSSLRRHAVGVPHHQTTVFDCCGTGGDGSNTFNVSTAAAFVVASCGVPTAKHGNRAVSSSCGSADILEEAGAKIDVTPEHSAHLLDEIGFCFLFAPLYHPATARVAKVRRELGFRTVFNLIGPLLNPARATHQIIGTSNHRNATLMASVAGHFTHQRVVSFHNESGVDELLPGDTNVLYRWSNGHVRTESLSLPELLNNGFALESVRGGDRSVNLTMLLEVLRGTESERTKVTALNAGVGLLCADKVTNVEDGYKTAMNALRSGAALRLFEQYVTQSREIS
ncbi:MAG: anthranilate phosphoribosyltransferase [Candidatus Zixiibacteriota bacterium]